MFDGLYQLASFDANINYKKSYLHNGDELLNMTVEHVFLLAVYGKKCKRVSLK